MHDELRQLASTLTRAPGVPKEQVATVLRDLGLAEPPADYQNFMALTNGADGFLSDASPYLFIYPIEQVRTNHHAYGFPQYAPRLVLFGCDGGGTSFSFAKDPQSSSVYAAEFTSLTDATPVAGSFIEFLRTLRDGRWP